MMYLSEKNVPLNNQSDIPGTSLYQNKKRFISLISATNLSSNNNKIYNIINSLNLNNMSKNINTSSILNKIIINQTKQENILSHQKNKESSFQSDILTNVSDVDNIFLKQVQNKEKCENTDNINNNINNNDKDNINQHPILLSEKTQKMNSVLKSHQLINSLLKNQNYNTINSNRSKNFNNISEFSFSSSADNFQNGQNLKKNEISPSKNSELISNINQNDSFSKNLYLQHWNNHKREIIPINDNKHHLKDFSCEKKTNAFLESNKDNNNYKLSTFDYYNNITNNRNKKYSNSPLRMADVFKLNKHHSINPYDNNTIGKNNDKMDYVESIAFNNNNMRKVIFIKSSASKLKKNESKMNEDDIKEKNQEKKENEEIGEITEIKEMAITNKNEYKEIDILEIKEEKKENDNKIINIDNKENKKGTRMIIKESKEKNDNKEKKYNKENHQIIQNYENNNSIDNKNKRKIFRIKTDNISPIKNKKENKEKNINEINNNKALTSKIIKNNNNSNRNTIDNKDNSRNNFMKNNYLSNNNDNEKPS